MMTTKWMLCWVSFLMNTNVEPAEIALTIASDTPKMKFVDDSIVFD